MADSRIRRHLAALAEREHPSEPLPPAADAPRLLKKRGMASTPEVSKGGGGIASPLTEQDFERRKYHEGSYFFSSDFLSGLEIEPLEQITFNDADGNELVMNFAEPEMD